MFPPPSKTEFLPKVLHTATLFLPSSPSPLPPHCIHLHSEYDFLQSSAQAVPSTFALGGELLPEAGQMSPATGIPEIKSSLYERLLCVGIWVKLWGIDMHQILALTAEVQDCNPGGISNQAGGPLGMWMGSCRGSG